MIKINNLINKISDEIELKDHIVKKENINTCDLCCEKTNIKSVLLCQNKNCKSIFCKKCIKTWLLSDTNINLCCMTCNTGYTRGYLIDNLGKTWVNSVLDKNRSLFFYNNRLSKLVNYHKFVKYENELKIFIKRCYILLKVISGHKFKNGNLFPIMNNEYIDKYEKEIFEENNLPSVTLSYYLELIRIKNIRDKLTKIFNRRYTFIIDLNKIQIEYVGYTRKFTLRYIPDGNEILPTEQLNWYWNIFNYYNGGSENKKEFTETEKNFISRGNCPISGCVGVIEDKWSCSICSTKICMKCMVPLEKNEHICNENDLASVKLLREDTKPCPSCRVRVFRIHGCNQMWCTNCNTAFNYNTLAIINNNRVHNPHYTEYLLKNNIKDINNSMNNGQVNGQVNQGNLPRCIDQNKLSKLLNNKSSVVFNYLRRSYEIMDYDIRVDINDYEDLIKRHSIEFLKKTIVEDKFKSLMVNLNKKIIKKNEVNDIKNVWALSVENTIANFVEELITYHDLIKLLKLCDDISQKAFEEYSIQFNCVKPSKILLGGF